MSTEITTTTDKLSALTDMSERLGIDRAELYQTLQKTVFKDCRSKEEFAALVITANEYGLNPLLKQIYAFPKKGGGIEPMVPIDGWLKIINSHGQFDGLDVTVSDDGLQATCTIYRKDRQHATVITEYLDECKRTTEPWRQMPKRMLRNKAIIQAARVAFSIGGIMDPDEAQDVGVKPANARPVIGKSRPASEPVDFLQVDTEPEPEQEPSPEPAAEGSPQQEIAGKLAAMEVSEPEFFAAMQGAGMLDKSDGDNVLMLADDTAEVVLKNWSKVEKTLFPEDAQ